MSTPMPMGLQQTQELGADQIHEKPANAHDTKYELPGESSSAARR